MAQMSFLEKLKILVDVSSSSGICIASIFLILFMGFLFLTTTRKNSKNSKKLYILIYLVLITILLVIYHSSLSNMFDYMMNNFFILFYFPNLAIYLAAIIATNILLWTTIFNFKEDKLLKVINTIVYCIIHYLLILILNIVTTNKLNVFDQKSVYGNKSALALITLTSTIFVVWIIFMIIYKIIRKNQKGKEVIQPVKEVVKYKRFIPSNIIEIEVPSEVKNGTIRKKQDNTDLINFYEQQNSVLEKHYNDLLEEQRQQEIVNKYENMLTLDDYKTVLNILKTKNNTKIKKDNHEINNNPYIVNTRVIEKNNDSEVKPSKLEELLNLSTSY